MKKNPVFLFLTLMCVLVYTESKALNALIIGTNNAVVSGYSGVATIRIMENNVDRGIVAPPFFIASPSTVNYAVVGGLVTGRTYKFQVIVNGVASPWSNQVTSF